MRKLYVLLIEDNRDDEEIALWVLSKAGFTDVTVARDGAEALEILLGNAQGGTAGWRPDIVFLDLKLPKIDGKELLMKLRGDVRTKDLNIVALTSSEDPEDKKICQELGVLAFMSKPLLTKNIADLILRKSEQ